jgi:hypothetical protein
VVRPCHNSNETLLVLSHFFQQKSESPYDDLQSLHDLFCLCCHFHLIHFPLATLILWCLPTLGLCIYCSLCLECNSFGMMHILCFLPVFAHMFYQRGLPWLLYKKWSLSIPIMPDLSILHMKFSTSLINTWYIMDYWFVCAPSYGPMRMARTVNVKFVSFMTTLPMLRGECRLKKASSVNEWTEDWPYQIGSFAIYLVMRPSSSKVTPVCHYPPPRRLPSFFMLYRHINLSIQGCSPKNST